MCRGCDAGHSACVDVHVTACSFPSHGVFRRACYGITVMNRPFVCAQHNSLCVSLLLLSHWLILSFHVSLSFSSSVSVSGNYINLSKCFAAHLRVRLCTRTDAHVHACAFSERGCVVCGCPCLTLLVQLIGFFLQAFFFFFLPDISFKLETLQCDLVL